MACALKWCTLAFSGFLTASATAVNRSVDDTLGDSVTGQRPTFLPDTSGVWEDNTCAGCALAPPISSAFDGTYTAATYSPDLKNISISFDFTGTAIYIFFILSNDPDPDISSSTATNFTLDGNLVDTFHHSPNGTGANEFLFNSSALAFSKTGMTNVSHQMVISTSGLSSDYYLNFDYALYTFQEMETSSSSTSTPTASTSSSSSSPPSSPSSSSSPSTPIGAIVGGVVGGAIGLAALVVGVFLCIWRRRRHSNDDEDPNNILQREIDPFILPSPTTNVQALADSSLPDSRPSTGVGSRMPPPPLPTDPKALLRHQRQQELDRQVQQMHDEIQDLRNEATGRNPGLVVMNVTDTTNMSSSSVRSAPLSRSRSVRSPDGKEHVSQLKAQIKAMSEHIAFLQDQQHSAWAQGLSDEPPPGYTPNPEGHERVGG